MKCVAIAFAVLPYVLGQAYGGYGDYGDDTATCDEQTCYPINQCNATGADLNGQCICGPSSFVTGRPEQIRNYKNNDYYEGLCKKTYEGYWCDDVNFFKENDATSCQTTSTISLSGVGNESASYNGVFHAKRKGKYYFRVTSSDASAVVLGGVPIIENLLVHTSNECTSSSVYLKKGYYKIAIYHGHTAIPWRPVGRGICNNGDCKNCAENAISCASVGTGATDVAQCQALCDAIPECEAIQFGWDAVECILFDSTGGPYVTTIPTPFDPDILCSAKDAGGSLDFEWKGPKQSSWTSDLSNVFKPSKCRCSEGYGYGGGGYGSKSKNYGGGGGYGSKSSRNYGYGSN